MLDEIHDRTYQQGRADLHAGLDRLFGVIGQEVSRSLKALHDLQWDAPWAVKSAASPKDAGCS